MSNTAAPFGAGTTGTLQPTTRISNTGVSVAPHTTGSMSYSIDGVQGGQGGDGAGNGGTAGVPNPATTAGAVPGVGVPAWEMGALAGILGIVGVL